MYGVKRYSRYMDGNPCETQRGAHCRLAVSMEEAKARVQAAQEAGQRMNAAAGEQDEGVARERRPRL